MTCPSGKEWPVKCGWHAYFQDFRGYFTTRWTTFAINNELKVDNKLLFMITSPSKIIVKVLGMTNAMLSANDKANEDDSENDTKEEDIIDDEEDKEKDEEDKDKDDEDDVDDDDDKGSG